MHREHLRIFLFLFCLVLYVGCDSTSPPNTPTLVVEGFIEAEKPLPAIKLTQAEFIDQPPDPSQNINVEDAAFTLFLNGIAIPYRPSAPSPDYYEPSSSETLLVPSGSVFEVEIEWNDQRAYTEDIVPTLINLDSVHIKIPDQPVSAILVDTLNLDPPEVGARRGFIYSIEVKLWWNSVAQNSSIDSLYWVETRLRPQIDFSSTVLDVFLLTEEVQLESSIELDTQSRHSWTGVYAVPVDDSLSFVPDHTLTIQLLRSTDAYALFASSRNNPERREPISNMEGAIGIIAGISLATAELSINQGTAYLSSPLLP